MTINPGYTDVLADVTAAIGGADLSHAMMSLFSVFVGLCQFHEMDSGHTFEALLATYEKRVSSTHRGSAAVN